MIYTFFDKKTASGAIKNEVMQNKELAEKLYKPIFRKFQKWKLCSSFKDNIWRSGLANMQLLSKFNIGIHFLLCFIDTYSKYAWVISLKDTKGTTIINAFQKILD